MGDGSLYAGGAGREAAVDVATLQRSIAEGRIAKDANVWRACVETPLAAPHLVLQTQPAAAAAAIAASLVTNRRLPRDGGVRHHRS